MKTLLAQEKERTARIVGSTPIYDFIVGNDEGQTPLKRLQRDLTKLPRNLTLLQKYDIEKRLRSPWTARVAAPAGPVGAGPAAVWLPDRGLVLGYRTPGGIDLEDRSQTELLAEGRQIGIPRDGGMADLLAAAAGPAFAAVVCEDIERSGRDTFNALKLERTDRPGIPGDLPPMSPSTSGGSTPPPSWCGG